MSAGGAPEFAGVEPGRRAWLYAILARAELALGRPAAAAEWVARGEAAAAGLGLPLRRGLRALRPRALTRALDARRRPAARGGRCAARAAELADSVGAVIQAGARADARRRAAPDDARRRSRCSSAPRPSSAACGAVPAARRGGARAAPARRARPARGGAARDRRRRARQPLRARARGRRPRRARAHQQGDRGRAVPVREDRREPHEPAVREARRVARRAAVAGVVGRAAPR